MSFDLGIWEADRPPELKEARRRYEQLCRGEDPSHAPSSAVSGLLQECSTRWKVRADDSSGPFTTKRTPTGLLIQIDPEEATEMYAEWSELAERHGLVLYDPQSGIVSIPSRLSFGADPPAATGHQSAASMLKGVRDRRANRRRS
jgi:hypothetical protein